MDLGSHQRIESDIKLRYGNDEFEVYDINGVAVVAYVGRCILTGYRTIQGGKIIGTSKNIDGVIKKFGLEDFVIKDLTPKQI